MNRCPHWGATVMARRSVGDYVCLTLSCGPVADTVRAGQYASVAVGGPASSLLLRRQLWIADAGPGGRHGGTLDVVVDPNEPGGSWLAGLREGAVVDVLAPLGRPFDLPRQAVACTLVGFADALAPLILLGGDLVERGCRVTIATAGPAYGPLDVRRVATRILDASRDDLTHDCDVIYAAGTATEVAAVAAAAADASLPCQAAIGVRQVCGTGSCTACAVPVQGRDGITRVVRACQEGPVFNAELVRWADTMAIPGDAEAAS